MPLGWITVKTVAVWAAATCTGMAVCWLGVRPVLDAAVPNRLVALQVDQRRSPSVVPSVRRTTTRAPGAPTSAAPSRTGSRPSTSPVTTPTPVPTVSVVPTTVDGWSVQANGDFVRGFQLVGGSATVRAGRGVVELVTATPRTGFVMAIAPTGDERAAVSFTAVNLRVSRLEVVWRDNAPVATIKEFP